MSYANGTTHYNLPQTVGTDKRDWTDTNQAFADIDSALYGAATAASGAASDIQNISGQIDTINGKLATDEDNISTLSGKVSTLEGTVAGHTTAISDVRQDLQDNIESHREASATSTHAYAVGDYFYYNDVLYKATADITVGGTIVPNTNCTGVTVMSEMVSLIPTPGQISAGDVSFDPTGTDLVSTDVEDALKEINAKTASAGHVEVTADGVESYSAALNRLFALIDFSKITTKSTFTFDVGTRKEVAHVARLASDEVNFTQVVASASSSLSEAFIVKASGSVYATVNVASGSTTATDNSTSIPNSGYKFRVDY